MKEIITILFISFIAFNSFAQENEFTIQADPNVGIFEFESEVIDYGKIAPNSDRNRAFKFKNIGKSPIIISRVKPSCGCTVPSKPNRPIMPGETAEIKVNFTTKKAGKFSKSITVTSNASKKTIQLRIKGEVTSMTDGINGMEKPKSLMEVK
ncbi:MAG: DUF1573 domain-containing protein [Flavobacteriaceae bacterium]